MQTENYLKQMVTTLTVTLSVPLTSALLEKNRVLLEEQYINDCFPSKKDNVGTALCATTDIQQGVLIGQYLGVVTTKSNGTSESSYIAQMARPNMENEHSKM